MKLLYEKAIQKCFNPSDDHKNKLNLWVKNSASARDSNNLDRKLNQYDKAEELITFYTFAPFVLGLDRVSLTNRILSLANVNAYEENVEHFALEQQFNPPKKYLQWLKDTTQNHPVKYIREKAEQNNKKNKSLETNTHVDAFIKTDKLNILFELKFTSDISYETTFNPMRNQLARLIDIGLETYKENFKQVLVILTSPRKFYEAKSRLYYYKVGEYTKPQLIQEDIPWRKLSSIQNKLLAVRWIALEDLIGVLYRDFENEDKEEALEFFKERNLLIS